MTILDEDWIQGNSNCYMQHEKQIQQGFCSPIWDRYLCWPPTAPGHIASLRCPPSKGIDTSQFATRICRQDGIWQGKDATQLEIDSGGSLKSNESSSSNGWTNYTQCFPPGIRELLAILNSQSEFDAQRKIMAAEGTRVLEMVGLSISIVSLLISLVIFCHFRNLLNNRTRIHRNLFIAMSIQVLIRLIVYSDQYISRAASSHSNPPVQFSNQTTGTGFVFPSTESPKGIEDTMGTFLAAETTKSLFGAPTLTCILLGSCRELTWIHVGVPFTQLSQKTTDVANYVAVMGFFLSFLGVVQKLDWLRFKREKLGWSCVEYVCECFYILLEYARTSMFLWMFVEGLHLHMITVAVFHERISSWLFYCIGWGSPFFLTVVWAVVTHDKFRGITCWWGYNLSPYFWILEGPRLTVIVLNLIFLLNIIRVLVTKLRESNSSEAQQVRKAVRAAIVLLPLLGITNSLQMVHSPVDKDAVQFAIWSYFTAFLTSFQGFFCALIYCFLNGEVQLSVRRCLRARKHRRSRHCQGSIPGGANSKLSRWGQRLSIRIPKLRAGIEGGTGGDDGGGRGNGISPTGIRNPSSARVKDPLQEFWNEAELSSHNNVDVENIEIPEEYYFKHGGKINFSRTENLNKAVLLLPNNSTSYKISS